jgi:pantetheine-phosphate adenylyltransferase
VVVNPKKQGLFTLAERSELLQECLAGFPEVRVESFAGLLVDYVRSRKAGWIVKGLRASSDFESEWQMARLNRSLAPDVDTLFLPAHEGVSFVSSTFVREIAALGGDVASMVPAPVLAALRRKLEFSGKESG